MAETALAKVLKEAISTLSTVKEHPKNELVQKAQTKLSENLKNIRAFENELVGTSGQ